ncbi:MAG TPA: ABC transporter permease [candidate division Zixibacteria bacterium]|nr:ABC transporter permease [candidate division Zixibacteria bacterium]
MEATASEPVTKRIWGRVGYGGTLLIIAIIAILVFYFIDSLQTEAVLASAIRQSTPLILGALCGLLGERTGVINIGIEGQMLSGAFVGFLVSVYTGNLVLAIFAGVLTGMLLGTFLALMSVTLKMDQIIGGTVINILAIGLTGFFYVGGLSTEGKLRAIPIPFLSDLPIVGKTFFNWPPLTYLAIILVFVMHYVLFYTRWGLRTRSVGEHPRAADTVGINVFAMRYINVTLAGGFAGLAGAFLTLEAVGSFERGMTNGRGFVALAVMIFGRWTPLGAWGAALLFGLALALTTQFQFMGINIPHQFTGMFPYVLTIVVVALTGLFGHFRPPAAVGQPYETEG